MSDESKRNKRCQHGIRWPHECKDCLHENSFSAPASSPIPVQIDERLIGRIGVREWGLPSMCIPGKIWRSEKNGTVTCMTAKGADRVNIETLPLVVVGAGEKQWLPDTWRAALWEYVQAWPHSGCGYGPWLSITEEQRCDFIRKMAAELVKSDNIGCRSIANSIGEFSAYGYQLRNPTPDNCAVVQFRRKITPPT